MHLFLKWLQGEQQTFRQKITKAARVFSPPWHAQEMAFRHSKDAGISGSERQGMPRSFQSVKDKLAIIRLPHYTCERLWRMATNQNITTVLTFFLNKV